MRVRDALVMIAHSGTVQKVAGRLNLAIKTVDALKYALMRKLEIHNQAELIKHAIREQLISLDP
jgi:two-component system, NarL family, response regulator NreC